MANSTFFFFHLIDRKYFISKLLHVTIFPPTAFPSSELIYSHLPALVPQLIAQHHSLLQQVLLGRGHVYLHLGRARLLVIEGQFCLHDSKQPFNPYRYTHARHLLVFGIEHTHKVVVATTTRHGTYQDLVTGRFI